MIVAVAVIVAVPVATPVTRPDSDTVAAAVAEELQTTGLLAGRVLAVSCTVPVPVTDAVAGVTSTLSPVVDPLAPITEMASAFSSRMNASYLSLPSQVLSYRLFILYFWGFRRIIGC